jgi:hypothetical protein
MRYGLRVKRPEMWLDKDGLPKYDVLNNDSIASPLKLKNQKFKKIQKKRKSHQL